MSKPDTHPTDQAPVIREGPDGPEVVQMRWGFEPSSGQEAVINIRAETADVSSHRCLIPATEFEVFTGAAHPKRRWKVTLRGEQLFFFAGLWRAPTEHWPLSFAALTIDAAPDLQPLTDRQMAVIRASDMSVWLAGGERARQLLQQLPSGSFVAELD